MTWLDHRSKRVEKCKLVGWWEEEKTRVISFSLLLPSGDPLCSAYRVSSKLPPPLTSKEDSLEISQEPLLKHKALFFHEGIYYGLNTISFSTHLKGP